MQEKAHNWRDIDSIINQTNIAKPAVKQPIQQFEFFDRAKRP